MTSEKVQRRIDGLRLKAQARKFWAAADGFSVDECLDIFIEQAKAAYGEDVFENTRLDDEHK